MKFHAVLKGLRRKELPELDDEFAQELGDYRTVDELKEAVRKAIFSQRQNDAQQEAKNQIVDKLVDAHDFPVPEAFVERQIKNRVEQRLRAMAEQGIDPKLIGLGQVKESQPARRPQVKERLLLSRSASARDIHARDEVDGKVEKAARQKRGGGGTRIRRWHTGPNCQPHTDG